MNRCYRCGDRNPVGGLHSTLWGDVCSDCSWACAKCGKRHTFGDAQHRVNGSKAWCSECYGNSMIRSCGICGTHWEESKLSVDNGRYFCFPCFENSLQCSHCNKRIHEFKVRRFSANSEPYCSSCFYQIGVECRACRLIHRESEILRDSNDIPFCVSCWATRSACSSCGTYVSQREVLNNPDNLCNECFNDKSTIHSHSYKPIPRFFPFKEHKKLYMGVELEVDANNPKNKSWDAYYVLKEFGNHVYIKQDGSLSNGFEIVTHPLTTEYHLTEFDWKKLCTLVSELGYDSHNTSTCGLHVHMSRNAFTETALMKFVFLIERFWDKWVKFSRRTTDSLDRWASRYYPEETVEDTYKKAVSSRSKYKAVNLLNSNTIELRIFRGTLKANTLKATLQMCQYLYTVAMGMSVDEITELTWEELVEGVPQENSELREYLRKLRLK